MKKASLWFTLLLVTLSCPAMVYADDSVFGLWAGEDSIFRIYKDADTLHGKIIALDRPVYTREEAEADPTKIEGQSRLDDNNPDEGLRDRTVIGLGMFSNYRFEDGQWQGEIYDPGSGNTYQSKMKLKDGKLEIRGYIGIPMFGRTAVFEPVSSCTEVIVSMLAMTDYGDACQRTD